MYPSECIKPHIRYGNVLRPQMFLLILTTFRTAVYMWHVVCELSNISW